MEDEVGRAFELERGRSVIRHELFQEAMGAMSRLGEELASVDSRLEADGFCLAEERRKLKVAINLGLRVLKEGRGVSQGLPRSPLLSLGRSSRG